MSDPNETGTVAPRQDDASWDVKVMELLQVASALAIGAMVLMWMYPTEFAEDPWTRGLIWTGLIIVAVTGLVWPLTVKPTDDASRYLGLYFEVTKIRIAGFEERRAPKDVMCALIDMEGFHGDAFELRSQFTDLVGEHRAHEYLPQLYAFLSTKRSPERSEDQTDVGTVALSR